MYLTLLLMWANFHINKQHTVLLDVSGGDVFCYIIRSIHMFSSLAKVTSCNKFPKFSAKISEVESAFNFGVTLVIS